MGAGLFNNSAAVAGVRTLRAYYFDWKVGGLVVVGVGLRNCQQRGFYIMQSSIRKVWGLMVVGGGRGTSERRTARGHSLLQF